MALATEELANNVITYGFRENKNNQILVRITRQDGIWYLRMRDDCRLFNPSRYVQLFEGDDVTAHIGIRMIAGMSSGFQYFSSMKMNQVMIRVGT